MPKLSQEQLAKEWIQHLTHFPPATQAYVQSLAEAHRGLLADHFYEHMLENEVASSFLSHQQVKTRLHSSMQQWVLGIFSLGSVENFEAVVAQQIKVGDVHARVGIPVHLVLRGARTLKERLIGLVHADMERSAEERWAAMQLIATNIDLAMEIMSYAYSTSNERNSRAEEAYRLFAVAQDIGSEKERQRAALLDWENQLMFDQAVGLDAAQLPRIGPSEFGLWFRHKGAHAFEGALETRLILDAMVWIDDVLLPAFDTASAERASPIHNLRELRELSRSIRFHLERLFEQSNELESGRDVLTRLLNRKFLQVVMSRQVTYARQDAKTFAVLAIDIDHFKRINDNQGHEAGDLVLQQMAAFLVNSSRAGDYLFRLGGEEFLMLLVDIHPDDARRTAEKLRKAIAAEPMRLPQDQSLQVTVSIGLAMFNGHPDYQTLMRRADDALYQAKHNGRNQVVVAG